jgi:hypothetical protein
MLPPSLSLGSAAGAPAGRTSSLVNAERSPTSQKISNNFKGQLVRSQVENFFDLKNSKLTSSDRAILRKNMNDQGWMPLSGLMQIKTMMYPGHDVMRDCIEESKHLELHESHEWFRVRDGRQRVDWMKVADKDVASLAQSRSSMGASALSKETHG